MREIKFRGKDSDTGEWRYGYYAQHEKVTLCPVYENKEDWKIPDPLWRMEDVS